MELVGENEFKVNLAISIGPLRGDVMIIGRFVEVREHSYAKITGKGIGIDSTLNFTLTFTINEINTKSKIDWVFEGVAEGLIALIDKRLVDAIAYNIVDDIINNIKKELLKQ